MYAIFLSYSDRKEIPTRRVYIFYIEIIPILSVCISILSVSSDDIHTALLHFDAGVKDVLQFFLIVHNPLMGFIYFRSIVQIVDRE